MYGKYISSLPTFLQSKSHKEKTISSKDTGRTIHSAEFSTTNLKSN